MREQYFINEAVDSAIKSYIASSNNEESIEYNSFEVVVIRILTLIYGKLDIMNPYYLSDSVAFINNLSKYGMSKADIAVFKEEFLNYYNFDKEHKNDKIRVKNPYFKTILQYLVDMFIKKQRNADVSYIEEEEFLDLAYTSHTKSAYRISINYLNSDDIGYIEKYYYSKLNEFELTKDLSKTISENINLKALQYVGVNLSNLQNMSEKEIEEAKKKAYNYFEVDADSPKRDEELQKSLSDLSYGKKLSTGNGYVDILLLMSVIVTSLSVIAIMIFSLM